MFEIVVMQLKIGLAVKGGGFVALPWVVDDDDVCSYCNRNTVFETSKISKDSETFVIYILQALLAILIGYDILCQSKLKLN